VQAVGHVLVDLGAGATPVIASVAVPAQGNPEPPPGAGEEFGKSSPLGLVVVLLLAVVTIALIVSMTRRLKRLPETFDEQPDEQPETSKDG
jgi:hypothetical protein